MYKVLIGICIVVFLMVGCTEVERTATVDRISYSGTEVTILFKDGLVITTDHCDDDVSSGDVVNVIHLTNGNIKITK